MMTFRIVLGTFVNLGTSVGSVGILSSLYRVNSTLKVNRNRALYQLVPKMAARLHDVVIIGFCDISAAGW